MVKIDQKRNQTIQKIIETATEVFARDGFEGARMDDIAKRAKVNKATIYYHIGDKIKLYEKVLFTVFGAAADFIEANIDMVDTPEAKLRAYIRTISQAIDINAHIAPIQLREIASGGDNLPESVANELGRILNLLTQIMEQGISQGVFEKVTPFLVHMMVVGGCVLYKSTAPVRAKHGPLHMLTRDLPGNLTEKITDEMETFVMKAILKKSPDFK